MQKTLITAHSGSDGYPANSLTFVQTLCDAGAEAIELDIRQDADGQYYLSHDSYTPSSTTDTKPPRLEDALDILRHTPNCLLNADLKEPGLEQAVLTLAQQFGVRTVISGSVELERLRPSDSTHVFYNLEYLIDYRDLSDEEILQETLIHLVENHIHTVQLDYHYYSDAVFERIRANGLQLSLWTAPNEEETTRLLKLGVANITTMTALPFITK